MRVKIDGARKMAQAAKNKEKKPEFDYKTAMLKWKKKDRRIYELKKLK